MTPRLSVAIVHYHLRLGGVRRVIDHTVASMRETGCQLAVVAGDEPAEPLPADVPVQTVPELSYSDSATRDDIDALEDGLKEAAVSALGQQPDLWHFHNHSLGKNPAVPAVVRSLADEGHRLLLHIHDFAEDARPGNYRMLLRELAEGDVSRLGQTIYPAADHVQYATLNNRDRDYLVEAGCPPSSCTRVSNPVTVDLGSEQAPEPEPEEGLYVYPARAIRRKNVGEVLLWAALAEGDKVFAITRAPRNPDARPVYERWLDFAGSLDLPVRFGTGEDTDAPFGHILKQASAVVTPSVAEGFGMCFLEPWLADRPLVGRNLPAITRDFHEYGLDLSHLYSRVDVPVDWVGRSSLRNRLEEGLRQYRSSYGATTSDEDVERAWSSMVHEGTVDFGRLDEPLQEAVIRRVDRDMAAASHVEPPHPGSPSRAGAELADNRRAVRENFNPRVYGSRLLELYRRAADSMRSEVEHLRAETLLKTFISPERFSLLRTGRP